MNIDEWREQAAKAAYEVWRVRNDRVVWDALEPRAQSLWLDIAHAVLGEGRIEFRQSAELAEHLTREENVRLVRIAREWAETAANYREAAERSLADFRTVSAQLEVLRDVAQNDTFRSDTAWLVSEVGREHIRRCEIEQCDTCSTVLGIEEKLQLLDEQV